MPDTHFVMIHGLASKPPKEKLEERYRKHLIESVDRDIPSDRFHVAYWADLMGYVPPDGPDEDEYVDDGENFRKYGLREKFGFKGLVKFRNSVDEYIESRLNTLLKSPHLDAAEISTLINNWPGTLAGRPARHLYGRFLPDLHRYFFGDLREPVRGRLREQLADVPAGADICLIAHSMGSIIAVDVVIADQLDIATLITIGSPLGLQVVQQQIGADDEAKQRLSTGVKQWFNLFDPLDIVAIDNDLNDEYAPSILDIPVANEFENKDDDRNHHKSYGYLRTPEMGEIVRELI